MSETRYGWVFMSVGVDSKKSIPQLRKDGAFNLDGEVYADNDQGTANLIYVPAEEANIYEALAAIAENPSQWEVD